MLLPPDPGLLQNLLFIHAWRGCDSTCATLNHGKLKILKLIATDQKFQSMTENFGCISTTKSDSLLFVRLFWGKITETTLSQLRYLKFIENIATLFKLNPATLPPSGRAACHHGCTVHIPVAHWKQLDYVLIEAIGDGSLIWRIESNNKWSYTRILSPSSICPL